MSLRKQPKFLSNLTLRRLKNGQNWALRLERENSQSVLDTVGVSESSGTNV